MSRHAQCRQCGATTTAEFLCPACLRATQLALADIPELADELELTISRQSVMALAVGSRSAERPLPYNDTAALKRSLIEVLVEWSDLVAHGTNTRPVPLRPRLDAHRRRAYTAVAIMTENLSWFAVDEQGPTGAKAIVEIRNGLRRAVDRPPERWYAGPCEAELVSATVLDGSIVPSIAKCPCDLYARPGQLAIICDGHRADPPSAGCGVTHSVDARRDWLLDHLEDRFFALDVLLAALPTLVHRNPDRATVRQWRKRNRLVARGRDRYGVELFRGGDVLDLARDETPRTGARRADQPGGLRIGVGPG